MRIVLSGGGSGGHLFPGLATACELRQRHPAAEVTFCGVGKDWERRQVDRHGFAYRHVASSPASRLPWGALRCVARCGWGYLSARRWFRRQRPDVVVGLGGYASVPAVLAASEVGVPVMLMEQNVVPGQATRFLAPQANVICLGFADAARCLPKKATLLDTGIPMRADIAAAMKQRRPEPHNTDHQPCLLLLGGSQGAHSLNVAACRALNRLAPLLSNWDIIHQTGVHDEAATRRAYEKATLPAVVTPFIEDMAEAYSQATVVVARSGAGALAELAGFGLPAVLVPFPHAACGHQTRNAELAARRGGAYLVPDMPDPNATAGHLLRCVTPLIEDVPHRNRVGQALAAFARPDATGNVVDALEKLMGHATPLREAS